MKIGFIGLGNMGVPMARNLATAGFEVLAYSRTYKNVDLASAKQVQSLSEVFRQVSVVILMLPDGSACEDVLFGRKVLSHLPNDSLVVNMSTIGIRETESLSQKIRGAGHRYVDAPVLGSVGPAEAGELTIVAGGDKEDFDALRAIFRPLSSVQYYMGANGLGAAMKLLVNAFLGTIMETLGETLAAATCLGLSRDQVYSALEHSAVFSPMLKAKREMVVTEEYPAAFALKHLGKDLGLLHRFASDAGIHMPAIESTLKTFEDAVDSGYGDFDMAAIVKYLATK